MDISNKLALLIAILINLGGFALEALGIKVAALPLLIFSLLGIVFVLVKNFLDSKNFKQVSVFPEINYNMLKVYAKRWVKEYTVLNIERVVLCRYRSNVYQANLSISLDGGAIPNKYVLIFIFSGSQDINLSMIENYPTQNDSEELIALKYIKFAKQFVSQGLHRLFDQAFPCAVYKNSPNEEYYREWSTELTRDKKMNDVPNIYPNESIVLWEQPIWQKFFTSILMTTFRAIKEKLGDKAHSITYRDRDTHH